jgi:hypothetical protein
VASSRVIESAEILENWNAGVLGTPITPAFHHSNTPFSFILVYLGGKLVARYLTI